MRISPALPLSLIVAASLFAAMPAAHAAPDYRISQSVALGGPDKWDYLAYDAASHRVIVSHGNEATLVDGATGAVVGRLSGINHGNGVLIAGGRAYSTSQKPDSLIAYDMASLKTVATIPVGEAPDGAIYDPVSRRAFVMNEDGKSVTAIDVESNKALFTTALGGTPEFAAADAAAS
jgi:YVTN family beta-propeller protein